MKSKKQQLIFSIYWIMLAYIIAALVWWFIALTRQNAEMSLIRKEALAKESATYVTELEKINDFRERKNTQYIGEGVIFFLLIAAAAMFIYRAVRRQFNQSREQQAFMMAITHELKTPVAVAQLNLETLQKHRLEPAQQLKLIGNTLQETSRLNALCNNLLLSSQMEAGGYQTTKEPLSVNELVSSITDSFITRYPLRQITFEPVKDITFQGDRLLLQMAINNLLDNALKYSRSAIRVVAVAGEKTIAIKVADEGPGIGDLEKKNIFKKFYRVGNKATRAAKGTGLGLYLTAKIASTHKGKIYVEDNKPAGSIFIIELPAG